jgi:hypothetical protein
LEKNAPPSSPSKPIFPPLNSCVFFTPLHLSLYMPSITWPFLSLFWPCCVSPTWLLLPLLLSIPFATFGGGMLLFLLLLFQFIFAGQKPFSGITSRLS